MTDRERLIDLMIEAKRTEPETGSFTDYLADYLLEHGVIVPPYLQAEVSEKLEREIKSEAVKEFAYRLKERASKGFWETDAYIGVEQIEELVKEMVGEEE